MNSTMTVILGMAVFMLGQIAGWFQLNSQLLWKWWHDKPFITALIFGLPTSILYWYAWRIIVGATESAWTARFIGSTSGLIVFPILTWFLLGETMLTPKTMICLGLTILIILIQLFY